MRSATRTMEPVRMGMMTSLPWWPSLPTPPTAVLRSAAICAPSSWTRAAMRSLPMSTLSMSRTTRLPRRGPGARPRNGRIVAGGQRDKARPALRQADLVEVQFALELAEDLVVDLSAFPHAAEGCALDLDEFQAGLAAEAQLLDADGGAVGGEGVAEDVDAALVVLADTAARGLVVAGAGLGLGGFLDVLVAGESRGEAGVVLAADLVLLELDAESLDEGAEREALKDERRENDRKDEEDDEVAVGEGRAVGGEHRDGECGGEGDDAAHAGPADNSDRTRGGSGLAPADVREEGARDIRGWEDPEQAHDDDGGADAERVEGKVRDAVVLAAADDGVDLQADHDEKEAVDEKDEGLPHGAGLEARGGGHGARALPGDDQARGDGGEHAGDVQKFGRDVRGVGGKEREHRRDNRLADARVEPGHEEADHEAEDNAAGSRGEIGRAHV